MKTIWVVGDSTVNAGNDRASCIPRIGWGDTLARYFTDRVQVKNLAIAGTSSKSFRSTDHYPALLDGIREGDAVIISFGHNDEKRGDVTFTSGYGSWDTDGSFANSLYTWYVQPARKKGAEVILATSIARRAEDGVYEGDRIHVTADGDYPQAMRDLGKAKNIPVLDLTRRTVELAAVVDHDGDPDNDTLWQHGRTGSPDICVDNTHTSLFGAAVNAWLAAEELKKSGAALAADLRPDLEELNPLLHAKKWKEKSFNPDYVEPVYVQPAKAPAKYPSYTDSHGNVWYASAFGDVMPDRDDFVFGQGEDGSMKICAGLHGNNGKIEQKSDGIAMYFVRIPVGIPFHLKGTVRLESFNTAGYAAQPAGYGAMVRDDMYLNEVNGSIMGDYVAGGITFRPGVDNGSNTFARKSGLLTFGGGELETVPKIGDDLVMEVYSTGDGYGARVGEHPPVLAGYDIALTRVDPDYIYAGFFTSRTVTITVRDIALTLNGKRAENFHCFSESR